MAEEYKILGQVAPAAASAVPLYTVPSSKQTVISTMSVCNRGGSIGTFRINFQPNGESLSDKHYSVFDASIAAKDTLYLTIGATLGDNDVLGVYSSTASLTFMAFGSEIS